MDKKMTTEEAITILAKCVRILTCLVVDRSDYALDKGREVFNMAKSVERQITMEEWKP